MNGSAARRSGCDSDGEIRAFIIHLGKSAALSDLLMIQRQDKCHI